MKSAYDQEDADDSYEDWKEKKESEIPHFKFWSMTRDMELLLLRYVRSLRTGFFDLYMKSLDEMLPWFFALDHGNYARWLPVHLHDMGTLYLTNPAIYNFVVFKTVQKFSSIRIDHAHEQNNKIVKGDRGAVGLPENSAELARWMISGPEVSRIVQEFKATYLSIKMLAQTRSITSKISAFKTDFAGMLLYWWKW